MFVSIKINFKIMVFFNFTFLFILAEDRKSWKRRREAFAQQWDEVG